MILNAMLRIGCTEAKEGRGGGSFNNLGKRWWWLGPGGSHGGSEKCLESEYILKVEYSGFGDGWI